jgi:hypothetical protein
MADNKKKLKKPIKGKKDAVNSTASTVRNNAASAAQPRPQQKTTASDIRKVPRLRMAKSASDREIDATAANNAALLDYTMRGEPVNVYKNGTAPAPQQQQYAEGNIPPVAGPPVTKELPGGLRERILQTIALQPMYADQTLPGGQSAFVGYGGAQNPRQDRLNAQAQMQNQAVQAGMGNYTPEMLREAYNNLMNRQDNEPLTEIEQAAINYARAEQSIQAGRHLQGKTGAYGPGPHGNQPKSLTP